jgi:4-hydroxy-3-polyprenylbenzoate decarboxylase
MKRIVVGLSGASGSIYGIRILEALKPQEGVETHLIITRAAEKTLHQETGVTVQEIKDLADFCYPNEQIGAAVASGSFLTDGMVVAPCSINTMSSIASGITSNLLTRAADVTLKERRRLVLCVRETPLHLGHLRTLVTLTEMGAVIAPPMPAFYHHPKTIDDLVSATVERLLDLVMLPHSKAKRWNGI